MDLLDLAMTLNQESGET